MAKEALDAVKEAEDKAREIMAESAQKARDIRRNAEGEAERKFKEILLDASKEADILKAKAKAEGEGIAKPILEKGKQEASRLESLESKDLGDAVNIIFERIVKANGNR
jgi:V/A-type H+-transporting ATPase subunit G/H